MFRPRAETQRRVERQLEALFIEARRNIEKCSRHRSDGQPAVHLPLGLTRHVHKNVTTQPTPSRNCHLNRLWWPSPDALETQRPRRRSIRQRRVRVTLKAEP